MMQEVSIPQMSQKHNELISETSWKHRQENGSRMMRCSLQISGYFKDYSICCLPITTHTIRKPRNISPPSPHRGTIQSMNQTRVPVIIFNQSQFTKASDICDFDMMSSGLNILFSHLTKRDKEKKKRGNN